MRQHIRWMVAGGAAVLALAGVPATAATAGESRVALRAVELDGGGYAVTSVRDITSNGQIVGNVGSDAGSTAATWRRYDAPPVLLNTPDPHPHDINARGDVLGNDWYWHKGGTVMLSDPSRMVAAEAMNDRGQIVGTLLSPAGEYTAFLYENGRFTELPTPAGRNSIATAINNRGEVLGAVGDPYWGESVTTIWRDGGATSLTVPGPAQDINDRGQVLINTASGPGIWKDGVVTELGCGGSECGYAVDINNAGDAVGQIQGGYAALWRNGRVIAIPLPAPTGWEGFGFFVNDRGDVAGRMITLPSAERERETRAFLWRDGRLLMSEGIHGDSYWLNLIGIDARGTFAGLLYTPDGERYPLWTPTRR
ncbi:MAG TPA: hypothetical protein VFT95_04515 [Micromonosporaceae bacterium]|nr:hypothetical protein [Micromonosporaceae bacterium]